MCCIIAVGALPDSKFRAAHCDTSTCQLSEEPVGLDPEEANILNKATDMKTSLHLFSFFVMPDRGASNLGGQQQLSLSTH